MKQIIVFLRRCFSSNDIFKNSFEYGFVNHSTILQAHVIAFRYDSYSNFVNFDQKIILGFIIFVLAYKKSKRVRESR